MKRGRKPIPAAEKELADRFTELVLAKEPALYLPGFLTPGQVDPHHVCRKNTLRNLPRFRFLEPEELWEIVWDPDNGVPVERGYHDLLSTSARKIKPSELRSENISFARENFLMDVLRRECPDFDAAGVPSA